MLFRLSFTLPLVEAPVFSGPRTTERGHLVSTVSAFLPGSPKRYTVLSDNSFQMFTLFVLVFVV